MSLKLISYEATQSELGARLVEAVGRFGEAIRISEGSLIVDTPLNSNQVLTKLLKVIDLEDHVYVLELSRPWAAYGEAQVNAFLEGHM